MGFSSCDPALVDRLQLCIPIEDSRQGCCVEALPQALASAFDVPWTASQTAVVVIGSKPGEGGGLFATDATDLGHAHQDGNSCAQTDTVDAGDQVEPIGEIAVSRMAGTNA